MNQTAFEYSDSSSDDLRQTKREKKRVLKKSGLHFVNFVKGSTQIDKDGHERDITKDNDSKQKGGQSIMDDDFESSLGLGSRNEQADSSEDDDETPGLSSYFEKRMKSRKSARGEPDHLIGEHEKHTRGMGSKLLEKMGYTGGGLGVKENGIVEPITVTSAKTKSGIGFGTFKKNRDKQVEFEKVRKGEKPQKQVHTLQSWQAAQKQRAEDKNQELKSMWQKSDSRDDNSSRKRQKPKPTIFVTLEEMARDSDAAFEDPNQIIDMTGPTVKVRDLRDGVSSSFEPGNHPLPASTPIVGQCELSKLIQNKLNELDTELFLLFEQEKNIETQLKQIRHRRTEEVEDVAILREGVSEMQEIQEAVELFVKECGAIRKEIRVLSHSSSTQSHRQLSQRFIRLFTTLCSQFVAIQTRNPAIAEMFQLTTLIRTELFPILSLLLSLPNPDTDDHAPLAWGGLPSDYHFLETVVLPLKTAVFTFELSSSDELDTTLTMMKRRLEQEETVTFRIALFRELENIFLNKFVRPAISESPLVGSIQLSDDSEDEEDGSLTQPGQPLTLFEMLTHLRDLLSLPPHVATMTGRSESELPFVSFGDVVSQMVVPRLKRETAEGRLSIVEAQRWLTLVKDQATAHQGSTLGDILSNDLDTICLSLLNNILVGTTIFTGSGYQTDGSSSRMLARISTVKQFLSPVRFRRWVDTELSSQLRSFLSASFRVAPVSSAQPPPLVATRLVLEWETVVGTDALVELFLSSFFPFWFTQVKQKLDNLRAMSSDPALHTHESVQFAAKDICLWFIGWKKEFTKTGEDGRNSICLGRGNTPPGTFPLPPNHIHKECWVDINTLERKNDEQLYERLAQQYMTISKSFVFMNIDPTDKQLKEKCITTRDTAKKHRVLFHYNGRGVIPPQSKYFYVFDEQHKHYSPITLQSLSTSLRTPTVFVFDCQTAGDLISRDSPICLDGNVVLCACSSKESLPRTDKVPFDVFTSCLTTPIQMAMLWYFQKHGLSDDQDILMKAVMEEQSEQNSMNRQLALILQAITETIAYNMCPKTQFLALFRDDPFLARIMQNFLLAQRIMPLYGCNPVCYPPLPPTNTHPLWSSWDRACDVVFKRHGLVINLFRTPTVPREIPAFSTEQTQSTNLLKQSVSELNFFESHFDSFNIWLRLGCREEEPPTFLPIVMHALSNRILRPNGVKLLEQFLSLGPQMVNQAIYSGIVNSALRLLKLKTDQHPLLVSMWARIVSVDYHYASDLEAYQQFFFDAVFNTSSATVRAMALFVLTRILSRAKKPLVELVISDAFLSLLRMPSKLIRSSALVCIAESFRDSVQARNAFVALQNVQIVVNQLKDQHIEVRASAIYLLNKLNLVHRMEDEATPKLIQFDLMIPELLYQCAYDGAIMVRRELLTAVQNYLRNHLHSAEALFGPAFLIMLENNSSPYQLTLPFEKINRFGQNTPAVIYQSPSIYTQQLSSSYSSSSLPQSMNTPSLFRDSKQPSPFAQPDPNTSMMGTSYNNDNASSYASHNTMSMSFRIDMWGYRSSPAESYPNSVGFGSFGGGGMEEGSLVTDYTYGGLPSARKSGSSLSQTETEPVAPHQTEEGEPPVSSSPFLVQVNAENCQTKNVAEAFCFAWRLHSYYCVEHFNELGLTACKFSLTFRETVLLLHKYHERPEHTKRPILPAMHYTIIFQWLAMHWKKRCEGGYTRMNVINKKRGWLYDAVTAKEKGLPFIVDEKEAERQVQEIKMETDSSDVAASPKTGETPSSKGKHLPSFAVPVAKSPEEGRLASPVDDGGASSAPATATGVNSPGALSISSNSIKTPTRSIAHISGVASDASLVSTTQSPRLCVPIPVTPEQHSEKLEGVEAGANVAMSRLRDAMQQQAFDVNAAPIFRSFSPSESVATPARTRQTSQSFSVGQRPKDLFGNPPGGLNPRVPLLGVGQGNAPALGQIREGERGVPTSTTPNLGIVKTEKEFSLTQISTIQYYNGITHSTFHPTDDIIALGSSKRNTVGIYSVSLSPPPAANKHHSSRDKKKYELKQATNIKSFQIPPPQMPNLANERVKQKVAELMGLNQVRNMITSSPYASLLSGPPTFSPQNHPRLSSLDFINSATDTRMIISTQDSAINILSFPENEPGSRLIASFFAFPRSLYGVDRSQVSNGSSPKQDPIFNLTWSQPTGLLTASGTPGTFRVWDVVQEMCVCDEPTGFNTPVTVQEMDKTGWMLILGSKRMMRMFDRRMRGARPTMSLILDETPLLPTYPYFAFDSSISSVVFSSTDWSITAGTESTEVAIFDVRRNDIVQQTAPPQTITESWTNQPGSGMHSQSLNTAGDSGCFGLYHYLAHTKRCGLNLRAAAFAAHKTLPYVVLGAGNQVFGMTTSSSGINVMGRNLGVVPDKDTIVSTLKWHPTEKILMASYGGKVINIYG
ncbi:putative Regulatory-associated protein of mTOR [Blattamonas nauphoetae]|uniref:Regulatory-associated protein of mTOR n=1 Tax=Blattamonas nauphoetae TaxID=2049346 RepID=A0ABQ9Y9P4_9EUKA|nr:putative Regulatory-associated protein of mTOR [Blattamonas nauphoetae]